MTKRVTIMCCVVVSFLIGSCHVRPSSDRDIAVQLGPHLFHIPEANVVGGEAAEVFGSVAGLRPLAHEINLVFDEEVIQSRIPGFLSLGAGKRVYMTFAFIPEGDRQQHSDPGLWSDLWFQRNDFEHHVFEAMPGTPFYRAYDSRERPTVFFFVLKQIPDDGQPLPGKLSDYYLASCSHRVNLGWPAECTTGIVVEEFDVTTTTRLENLSHLSALAEFLGERLAAWRVDK